MLKTLIIFSIICYTQTPVSAYFNPLIKVVRPEPSYYTHSSYVNHHVPYTYNYYPAYNPAHLTTFNPSQIYQQPSVTPYDSHINELPTINILAENPFNIEKSFTVVPMLVVPEDNLNMISSGQITNVSKKKPVITIKTNARDNIHCTPAVRIVLETPIMVYSLKTSIIFPSQVTIVRDNIKIPIKVGAVIAPVSQDTYVSEENPASITVVYAIPTKPIQFDYVNNERDVIIDTNAQSVIVENNENSTKQPTDEDDSELVNRNPPSAPAGIVQSTQPAQAHLEVFQNPKESPVLIALREESKKRI